MELPVLDSRTKEDIVQKAAELGGQYLPGWRMDGDTEDPAAALTVLYSEMFAQTIDRFNQVPVKLYTEYLNLLGVTEPAPVPAKGIVRFTVHEGVTESIFVESGKRLFLSRENEPPVIYETDNAVEATPAVLHAVFYADSRDGVIQKLDPGKPMSFFGPSKGENLQKHVFRILHPEVLRMDGKGTVEVSLDCGNPQTTGTVLRKLCDPANATWVYSNGSKETPFDSVTESAGRILLEKKTEGPMEEIRVLMKNMTGEIIVSAVSLSSRSGEEIPIGEMLSEDLPIEPETGGYCFGKNISPFDSFYLRQDQVFSKRGAEVTLTFDLSFLQNTTVDSRVQYSFDKNIIDKNDAVSIVPEDVYISQVVWEYYNGYGWSRLFVKGDRDLFSGKKEGPLCLSFTVPENIAPVEETAEEGYYIRARVVDIENQYSNIPNYILPFVKGITCRFDYAKKRAPERLSAENNGSLEELSLTEEISDYQMKIYEEMPGNHRAMYLCFNASPDGLPLSLMFDINGRVSVGQGIRFEAFDGKAFRQISVEDGTSHFEHSGIVNLYLHEELPKAVFFSEEGFWIRISPENYRKEGSVPVVSGIYPNCVRCSQKEHSEVLTYSTAIEEAGKKILLPYVPVLETEVWVDEKGSLLESEAAEIRKKSPKEIRPELENGEETGLLVSWHRIRSLSMAGPEDRVYELDPNTGELTFGNGVNGKIPPRGTDNIRIVIVYGGGEKGNAPEGALEGFLAPIPKIAEVKNITPMTGGVDRIPRERIEFYGNKVLRHRGRAVSPRDFEEIVLSGFADAEQVKCFSDTDAEGREAPGHVCVVVKAVSAGNEGISWELCREIREDLLSRCDACLASSGRLHVRPAIEMTVNTEISLRVEDLSRIVRIKADVLETVEHLITEEWARREIGHQVRIGDFYAAIAQIPGVSGVETIFVEGIYYREGKRHVIPVENDDPIPFVTVTSGEHKIRIS